MAEPRAARSWRQRLRQHGVTLGLGVAALALALVVLWDRGRVTTSEAEDRKYQLFDAWRSDDITGVRVQLGDRQLRLEALRDRDGARSWKLMDGETELDVDEQAVGQLLVALEFAGFERRVEGIAPGELGLGEPRAVFGVDMGALSYRLRLGGPAPSPEGAHYAEVDGGARGPQHYVVGRELVERLEVGASELQSRGLVPYLSTHLESIALQGPGTGWKLSRGGWGGRTAGAFLLEAPSLPQKKVRASRRALDGWLVKLARLEVERFVDLPDEPAAGAWVLTMTPRDQAEPEARLELGGSCPGGGTLVVRRAPRPSAGCAPEALVSGLFIDAGALADRHVVGTAVGDMIELVFAAGETTVELARKEDSWHMRKPTEGPVAAEATRALTEELGELEGVLVAPEEVPEEVDVDPAAQLRIVGLPERGAALDSPERIEQIEIGKPKDGFVHARRKDDGALLRIPEASAQALLPRAAALRSARVYDESIHDVRALRLDCGGKRQRLTREPTGSWKLLAPEADLGADTGLAGELAEAMRELTAVRWIGESRLDAHGLDAPWCKIVLEVAAEGEDEPRALEVRLGAETQGGYFALHDDDPAVFVAPRALGAMARRWLLDRSALLVDLADVDRVVLRGAEKELVLLAHGDRWTVEGAPNSRAGDAVKRALEQLLAEQVVHLGAAAEREGMSEPALVVEIELRSAPKRTMVVGAADSLQGLVVRFVRRRDVEVTFAVAEARLRPLLDAL